ncbi:MAG: AraC family transcriptional regulator [Chitinophagaceae bacterium]|nr:AraC family transcriptional regulator [Chitinophagaceae bacterium]
MLTPKLLKVAETKTFSFDIRHEKAAYFDNPWHYHPEFELTLVTSSRGIRFVGDSVEQFEEDDLVLLGSNLPHYWRNDEEYYKKQSMQYAEAYILRFRSDLIKKMILDTPETIKISQMFTNSSRGIWFTKTVARRVHALFIKILHVQGTERIIGFLELMHLLSMATDGRTLSTKSFTGTHLQVHSDRIDTVLKYINNNLQENVSLELIAAHVNMNATAFCRYIKKQTNKTFVQLLNDIRIANACRLLLDGKHNIAEISYQCGFKNATHFNYIFKKLTGYNPSGYREKWNKKK